MSALATVNDLAVVEGRVTFPLQGAWVAELIVQGASPAELFGPCTVAIGGVLLVGTGHAAKDDAGRVSVTVTAGAGGLGAAVETQHYTPPATIAVVLRDALAFGSEVLSPAADAATLAQQLPQWTRVAGTVREATRRAVAAAGAVAWRHLPDGTVWVGPETWLPTAAVVTLESEEPTQQLFTVALSELSVFPGTTYRGQRLTQVEYTLSGSTLRARLSYGSTVSPLRAMVREETAGQDYTAPYTATVVGQNADGTVELRSGDARMPNMSKVPIRPGLPGLVISEVPTTSVAIVEFENGDPARPVVTGWLAGSATRLAFDAEVVLGGGLSVTTRAAVAELVKAELDTLANLYNTHTHTGVMAGPASSGTTASVYTPGDVAAQRVRLQ
jgi:hypothetical protein